MTLDVVLKRYFPVVLLALVAVAAYFQASAVTQFIGTAIAIDEKSLLASGGLATRTFGVGTALSSDHKNSAAKIIERNPFDSVKGNLNPPPDVSSAFVTASGPPLPATDDPYHAPLCDQALKVLATAVSEDAAWSFASLVGGDKEGSKLKRQGDDYAGKRVWFVTWDRVWLIAPGSFCQVEMFPTAAEKAAAASASAAPSAAPAAPASSSKTGVPSVAPEIASKIQKVSANEFNIDRGVIDKILENQTELMRAARVVPEQENGKTVGVRMFGIRPDTLLGVLGMENGDRLEKINGFDMASPEKALEAYARLRTADHLTVSINRRGQAQNIDFNIK